MESARIALDEATAMAPDLAEVMFARARFAEAAGRLADARAGYQGTLDADPDHADAHYAMADLLDPTRDRARVVQHLLRVLELDARADRRAGVGTRTELDWIERVASQALERLPETFSLRLRDVPIVLEPRPDRGIVQEGFDPRALGLFEGTEDRGLGTEGVPSQPTRIVLFYANLLAAFPDPDALADEIEVTILHEIGHFFGLDEDQVAALGLD